MTRNVRLASPADAMHDAAQMMDVGVLPVGGDDRIIGMLTDRDLATEQPGPGAIGRALGRIAREGGLHRQRPVSRIARRIAWKPGAARHAPRRGT